MKNTNASMLIALLLFSLGMSSCVTKGKYLLSEGNRNRLSKDSASTHSALTSCNGRVMTLEETKAQLEKDKADLLNKYSKTNSDLKNTQQDLQNLNSSTKMTIEEQQKRLKNLQDLIQNQRDVMNKLKKTENVKKLKVYNW